MHKPLLAALLAWPLLLRAEPVVVTLAVDEAHPPYVYTDAGQPAGLYVQLLQRAMARLPQWELKLRALPWKRALATAEQGDVDGLLPPYRSAGRGWMAAYAGPLYREEVVVLCDAGASVGASPSWPDSFSGLRIGTPRAYFLSRHMSSAVSGGKVLRQEFNDARDALAAMAGHQIDCIADDHFTIQFEYARAQRSPHWASRMPRELEDAHALEVQETFVGFSRNALARRPELAEFIRALDQQLAQLRASGETERLARGMLGGDKP